MMRQSKLVAIICWLDMLAFPCRGAAPAPHIANGAVVTTQHLATDVGAAILRAGGNAVDAAVAVGFALAVVHPAAGNLGGGGFMTIHFPDGHATILDFRERAPLAATAGMFLDGQGNVVPHLSSEGYKAVAIPGSVLGLETARAKYGTMTRRQLMAPAIDLAHDGFTLEKAEADLLQFRAPLLSADADAAAIFTKDRAPLQAGDRLVQRNLAATLTAISNDGADAFYRGAIAAEIVAASQRHGGLLQRADFENYKIHERAPLQCSYRGYVIAAPPPPSSGGVTLCEMLKVLEGYPLGAYGFHSAEATHLMIEAMRAAFYDRNTRLGDPDFVKDASADLIGRDHIAQIRKALPLRRARPSRELGAPAGPNEGRHTTNYAVVDRSGLAVDVSYTLDEWYGAGVVAGDTGILLNNEMDDFTAKPGEANQEGLVTGSLNSIAPGKAPLSSLSPTIVSKDGRVVLVSGSLGSGSIITSILQVIVNRIDFGLTPDDAVQAPRFHHQWYPDVVRYEPGTFSPAVLARLQGMGHVLKEDPHSGATESIFVTPGDGARGINDHHAPMGSAAPG